MHAYARVCLKLKFLNKINKQCLLNINVYTFAIHLPYIFHILHSILQHRFLSCSYSLLTRFVNFFLNNFLLKYKFSPLGPPSTCLKHALTKALCIKLVKNFAHLLVEAKRCLGQPTMWIAPHALNSFFFHFLPTAVIQMLSCFFLGSNFFTFQPGIVFFDFQHNYDDWAWHCHSTQMLITHRHIVASHAPLTVKNVLIFFPFINFGLISLAWKTNWRRIYDKFMFHFYIKKHSWPTLGLLSRIEGGRRAASVSYLKIFLFSLTLPNLQSSPAIINFG